jgi:hypothetical protein
MINIIMTQNLEAKIFFGLKILKTLFKILIN